MLIFRSLVCVGDFVGFMLAFSANEGALSHWISGLVLAFPGVFICSWGTLLDREGPVDLKVTKGCK